MLRSACPCCDTPMLRHARQGGVYWFCTSCRQDMPTLPNGGKLTSLESLVKNSTRPIQAVNP